MSEKLPSQEKAPAKVVELINYNGNYVYEVTKPGTEIEFDIQKTKGTVEEKSFDMTGITPDVVVALDMVDYDGNRSILVGGPSYGDLVCKLTPGPKKTEFEIQQRGNFTANLLAAPLTVGARHEIFDDAKLTKVSALPMTGVTPGAGTDAKGSSPVYMGSDLLKAYTDS